MAKHNETGINGEQIAENFLLKKGYLILEKNKRFGKKEVDLIALKDDIIVFVEVKTRGNSRFGYPEEFVNKRKQQLLKQAATIFLDENPQYEKLQFDIVSIILNNRITEDIIHYEDAFY